jgi:hypothetical protein
MPTFTAVGPKRVYGLFAGAQVVFEDIMPITFVPVCAEPKCSVLTNEKPQIVIAIKKKLKNGLFNVTSIF